jgi:cyclase
MSLTANLRIFSPHPGLYAYYDGRTPGIGYAPYPNWVDDGALALGIATYALVEGDQALVYDTHVSAAHGHAIRQHLSALGVAHFTVVYSHCHLDHVAGTAAFAGAEVIANVRTAEHLKRDKRAIEAGTLSGPPAISPLILPTQTYSGRLDFRFGRRQVSLIEANIHSDDATVLWLPDQRILLAGDTVEDCATYVGAPEDFAIHLAELDRLIALDPKYVLPDHGDEAVLRGGGYSLGLLGATQSYIRWLMGLKDDPSQGDRALDDVIGPYLSDETLRWFPPYEDIHRQNVKRTLALPD